MTQVLGPQVTDQTYTFSSHPSAIQNRNKYREKVKFTDETVNLRYGNLMYDRRVIRGNTHSQHLLPITAMPDPIELQRQQESRRRAIAKKRAREQLRPKTPEAVDGRQHQDVQTELYLEELIDRIEEADVEAQTDDFLDRPPTPLFVPAKSGIDMFTEILPGDLFNFDTEVKEVLEVLVGKTVEQSCLEVLEEEELENLRCQQRMFLELRNAEKVEQQRLEEQDRRLREEKNRRKQQQLEIIRLENETAQKIAAKVFAQSYLTDLVPTVFGTLSDHGYFYDPVERDVEQGFLPWLMDSVCQELDHQNEARIILDMIIREAVTERHIAYHDLEEQIQRVKLADEASKALGGQTVSAEQPENPDEIIEDGRSEEIKESMPTDAPEGESENKENENEDQKTEEPEVPNELSQIVEENPEEGVEE